eukprot:gene8449-4652_t
MAGYPPVKKPAAGADGAPVHKIRITLSGDDDSIEW